MKQSLNRYISQGYSCTGCNEAVLGGPRTSKPLHGQCIPEDTEPGISHKPLPGQKIKPYLMKNFLSHRGYTGKLQCMTYRHSHLQRSAWHRCQVRPALGVLEFSSVSTVDCCKENQKDVKHVLVRL